MSKMKYIENIDFYHEYSEEELLEQKLNNPLRQWRDDASQAYKQIEAGNDNAYYMWIVIENWIDYIHITKGEQYAKSHKKLAEVNLLELYIIAVNGFNL